MSARAVISLLVLVSVGLFAACQRTASASAEGTTTTQASSGSEPMDPAASAAPSDGDAGAR
jgi:hypothetical protein